MPTPDTDENVNRKLERSIVCLRPGSSSKGRDLRWGGHGALAGSPCETNTRRYTYEKVAV